MNTYGFTVEKVAKYAWPEGFGGKPTITETGNWYVHLPHQCDDWSITEDEYDGVPYEDAVKQFEQFIKEANDALERLKLGKELRHD